MLYVSPYLWSASIDGTVRVWDVSSGRCIGCIGAGPVNATGHTGAVSCLEFINNSSNSNSSGNISGNLDNSNTSSTDTSGTVDNYIASGSADGDVKLWKSNGEYVHTCSHNVIVTSLRTFQDSCGGQLVLLIGLLDGRIVVRSCMTMLIMFTIPNSIYNTKAVWSLTVIPGSSCFAAGGEDGQLIIWRITQALVDTSSG